MSAFEVRTASAPRISVVVFPGTWSERDFAHVAATLGWDCRLVWHAEESLPASDAVVLPGGFAHGDHLRTGAIARFSPVMRAVEAFAAAGGPVLGSCNGFQILCEAGLLPGVLLRNDHLEFRCDWQWLRAESTAGPWLGDLAAGDVIRLPISHGEGRFHADDATLDALEARDLVALRYTDERGALRAGRQPERIGTRHRRHHERARQRAGPDAPPGARRGGRGGRHRRPAHLPFARDLARPTAGRRRASAMMRTAPPGR